MEKKVLLPNREQPWLKGVDPALSAWIKNRQYVREMLAKYEDNEAVIISQSKNKYSSFWKNEFWSKVAYPRIYPPTFRYMYILIYTLTFILMYILINILMYINIHINQILIYPPTFSLKDMEEQKLIFEKKESELLDLAEQSKIEAEEAWINIKANKRAFRKTQTYPPEIYHTNEVVAYKSFIHGALRYGPCRNCYKMSMTPLMNDPRSESPSQNDDESMILTSSSLEKKKEVDDSYKPKCADCYEMIFPHTVTNFNGKTGSRSVIQPQQFKEEFVTINNRRSMEHLMPIGTIKTDSRMTSGEFRDLIKSEKEVEVLKVALAQRHLDFLSIAVGSGGIDPNIILDSYGLTMLHVACRDGDQSKVSLLIQAGANVNAQNSLGQTPLFLSFDRPKQFHPRSILLQLCAAGASVNVTDNRGFTCLHQSIFKGYLDAVEIFLKHRAHVFVFDNKGRLPLQYARPEQYADIKNLYDANVRFCGKKQHMRMWAYLMSREVVEAVFLVMTPGKFLFFDYCRHLFFIV